MKQAILRGSLFTLMIKLITPFEKISKANKTIILAVWIIALLAIWFLGTMGEKHLFPSPAQVFKGFSELYNEGLVVHIFNSLKACVFCLFFWQSSYP